MSAQTIHKSQKVSKADVVFNIILYGICGLILLLIAYPLYFIIIASFSNPSEVSNGNVWFWPSQFTLDGYKELLRHGSIWMGYWNTILYTVVGTAIGLIVNISAAYSLSRRDLVGRKLITFYFIFTMFFNGGLIPTYFTMLYRVHSTRVNVDIRVKFLHCDCVTTGFQQTSEGRSRNSFT